MRVIVAFSKGEAVKYVSHLDMQRLFQRAFRRAHLPLAYSQGFNPHPVMSFATALSVGITSNEEYLDVMLTQNIPMNDFVDRVNAVLPNGVTVNDAFDAADAKDSLTSLMRFAEYNVVIRFADAVTTDLLNAALDKLLSGEIVVMKNTKGGIKHVDIRPMVLSVDVLRSDGNEAEMSIRGILSASGGLNIDLFLDALTEMPQLNGGRSKAEADSSHNCFGADNMAAREICRTRIEMDWSVIKL